MEQPHQSKSTQLWAAYYKLNQSMSTTITPERLAELRDLSTRLKRAARAQESVELLKGFVKDVTRDILAEVNHG